jgi:hypothetical protein
MGEGLARCVGCEREVWSAAGARLLQAASKAKNEEHGLQQGTSFPKPRLGRQPSGFPCQSHSLPERL